MLRRRLMGCVMKDAIAAHHEYFVLQMDGRAKSRYRRFVDALRAGLQLRDQFPQHDIKVRSYRINAADCFALTRLKSRGSLNLSASPTCAASGGG
jgi:hypothetical protein